MSQAKNFAVAVGGHSSALPRSRRGRRHPLTAILGLVCCAILCGAKSYAAIAQWGADQDIALMHQLGFTRKPPKLGGIRKVLIALDLASLKSVRAAADPKFPSRFGA